MSTALEHMPAAELALRHARCRALLAERCPEAGGLLVFSAVNIYYLTGTLAAGILWLPREGEAVLMARKGRERAALESPLKHIVAFRSYSNVAESCAAAGSPLSPIIAAEMSGLTWNLADMLRAKLSAQFVDGSSILVRARAVKTAYELVKMREAGARHCASYEALASTIHPGMTEREVAIAAWNEFLQRDHAGILRMANLGAEAFLGQLATGDNANFPTYWDGPVGYMGGHPATPYMGHAGSVWDKNSPLVVDLGFNYQGYHTDKTQIFWSGSAASIPDAVRRAHELCVEIQQACAELLKPGNTPEQLWKLSLSMAEQAGMADLFMGCGGNQVKFLGHGIGLAYDEFPAFANRFNEPLLAGMTIALEPKMGLAGLGMVGIENVFEITETGAKSLTGDATAIVCIAE